MYLKKIKEKAALLFCCLLLCALSGTGMKALAVGRASSQAIVSDGYCVIDADTGDVILQRNMDQQYYPASTTKVLTALVAIENTADLNAMLAFSEWAISSLAWDSSTMTPEGGIGEQMTVREALYGLLLVSGNECGNALAEYVGGSEEGFVALMNQRAVQAGARHSYFVNAHGYHDENHYTTPYDLAMIFKAAVENPVFLEIDSTKEHTIPATNVYPARQMEMGHHMVSGSYDYPYAVAGKTGTTPEAGKTLVTYAAKDGMNLICALMKSTEEACYSDTEKLFEEGFGILTEERQAALDNQEGLNVNESQSGSVAGPEEGTEDLSGEAETNTDNQDSPMHVADRSQETSWIFWAVLITAGVSLLVAVVLVILILHDLLGARKNRRHPRG